MPIAPWNPGGFYPFTYGAPAGSPNTSTTPVTAGLPPTQGGAGSGSNVTGQAIANNLSAGPNLESLTNLINQLNISAQQQANAARIPNDPALEAASSANIGSLLGGNVPADIKRQLAQVAAERGVSIGSPGSDNTQSELLRSLGLTSLDLQQLGQQNLTAADARNPVAKLFDPTSQLITPAQQGALNNEANQLALEWQKYLHPNLQPTGSRGGTTQPTTPTTPDMGWFSTALNAAGNLNQPGGVAPVTRYAPPATTYDPNQLFGTTLDQPGYESAAPTDTPGYNTSGYDTGSLFDIPSGYDPFAAYG